MKQPDRPVPGRTIAFLAAASFASSASVRACDPILPEIARSLDTTIAAASGVITFFGATYACAQLAYGLIGDRFGKLETIAVTTVASAVTAVFCAFADSLTALIAARLFAGVTAAAIIPLSMAWIGDEVPYERRQPVIARFLLGQILGLTAGQAVSGIVAEHIGWRSVFLVLAATFLVTGVALAYELFNRTGRTVHQPVSFVQAARQLAPMLRRPWVLVVLVTVFIEGAAIYGAYSFVGSDLKLRFGTGYDVIGLIVGGFGVGGLLFAAAAPYFIARLGERGLALAGGILLALSFFALAVIPAALAAIPFTVVIGLGFYMLHNTLQTNATQMAPEARGLAVACFASCFFLGQAAGVSVAAPVFDRTGAVPLFVAAGLILTALGAAFRFALRSRP
jgi:predicted MFS family arabinose efflux permease